MIQWTKTSGHSHYLKTL